MAKYNNIATGDGAQSQTWNKLVSNLIVNTAESNKLAVKLSNINFVKANRVLNNKLKEIERRTSDFFTNLRHDIRTPLGSIVNLSQALSMIEDNTNKKECLIAITNSSEKILSFLNELLEFDNIDSDVYEVQNSKFNIRDIVDKLKKVLSVAIKQKNLEFTVRINDAVPELLLGDKFRTYTVLLNLLGNAVKFTDRGHIKLAIEPVTKERNKVLLKLIVEDSGIGIPRRKLKTIFEKFVRLTSAYKGLYKGSGCGLYIVNKFIKELGGEIKVDSVVGQGTKFTCLLPFEIKK